MSRERLKPHQCSAWVAIAGASAIVASAMLAVWPLVSRGQVHGLDILATVYRVFVLDLSIERGLFYPRIAPDLGFGYGLPLFQYYPPAAAYASEIVHLAGLGFVQATSVVFLLGVIAMGLGAFYLVRRLCDDSCAAVVAGLAYALAPYSLATIYTRGAGAEALALAVLPWFLAAFCQLAGGVTRLRVILAAAATCALVLAHNGLSLLAIPSLAAAVAVVALSRKRYREGIGQAGAILLGLGMSAFFWLPALAETGHVQMQAMTQGFYSATANLADVTQLVQTTLDFQYAPDQFSRLGLAQIVLAGISVAALPLLPSRRRRVALWATITLGLCTLLQTEAASPFWTHVPLVRYLQFPWRLLGFCSLAVAILAGMLPSAASDLLKRARPGLENATARSALGLLVAVTISALLVKTSLTGVYANWGGSAAAEGLTESVLSREDLDLRGALGFELFTDYWPAGVGPSASEIAQPTDQDLGQASQTDNPSVLTIREDRPLNVTVEASSVTTHSLRLHAFFVPGWRATVDGVPAVVRPSSDLALVTVDVPPGRRIVHVWYSNTAVRTMSTLLSALSIGLLAMLLLSATGKRAWALAAAGAVIVVVVLLRRQATPSGEIRDLSIDFSGFATLSGARLDRTVGEAGKAVDVRLYWYANATPARDYKVFVHLVKPDGGPPVAQHDGRPVEGFTSTTRWQDSELVMDDHRIQLPPGLTPGQYLIVAGLYDQDGNVPVAPPAQTVDAGRALIAPLLVVQAP
jgi:hypothetical protein